MTDQNILIPEVSDGAEIFPGRFWVISPEETTNLLKNPSVETAITGYALSNSTIARSVILGHQRRGFYGIDVTPAINGVSGVYYTTDTVLMPGQSYTFSCDVFGIHNCEYRIYFADVAGARLSPYTKWLGRNEWKRVSVTWTETSPVTRRLYLVRQPAPEADVFYTDGWQLENKSYATTYADGDQLGLTPGELAYDWNGTVHASTSYRISDTRAGGREMPIAGDGDGVKIMAVVGLGEPPVENFATDLNTGGAMYLNSVYKPRNFTLSTSMQSLSGMEQLLKQRKELRGLLSMLNTTRRQPMKLRYRTYDKVDCEVGGRAYDIVCCYVGGLEGNITNPDQERITMNFIEYDPGIREDGETAFEPETFELVDNSSHLIFQNKNTGRWGALTTEPNGIVNCMIENPDGTLYVGGAFTTFNGTAVNRICKYDPGSGVVTALGTGLNGDCRKIDIDSSGNVYAAGQFVTAGGTTVNGIAKWNGTAWSVFNVGASVGVHGGTASVYDVKVAPDGKVYIGGNYTDFCGIANTGYIAYWDGTTAVAMGTGANGLVICLEWSLNKTKLFIGGTFTTMNGSATYGISCWNHALLTWLYAAMTTGLPAAGGTERFDALELSSGGTLYGIYINNQIYQWSGSSWVFVVTESSSSLEYDIYAKKLYIRQKTLVGSTTTYINYTAANVLLATKSQVYYATSSPYKLASPKLIKFPVVGSEFATPIFRIENPCCPIMINKFPNGGNIISQSQVLQGEQITINTSNMSIVSNLTGNWISNISAGSVLSNFIFTKINADLLILMRNWQNVYNDASGNLSGEPFVITGLTFSNTDNHVIYISMIDDGAGNFHINIYKSNARAAGDLIAHTASGATTGYKALIADNASGVGGYIKQTAKVADADMYMTYGFVYMRWQNRYMSIDDVL